MTVITVIIEHILGATLCSKLCTYALYKTHHNRYYLHFIEEETEAFITLDFITDFNDHTSKCIPADSVSEMRLKVYE